MEKIHPTAIIDSEVVIGSNVTIGPYTWVHGDVVIGDNTEIGSHVVLLPGTRIGRECKIYHHAVLGEIPQDLKFGGEKTSAEVGDRTVIREFVTINRGTNAHKRTVVGTDCLLMAYVHIAHDCLIGNNVIMANAVNLAGHITIEDWVIMGGMTGVHQFCKIGQHAMVGGHFRVPKDVPPYIIAANEPLSYSGLNMIGLKRRGFSPDALKAMKNAYHLIYQSEYNVSDAVKIIESDGELTGEVRNIIEFIKTSERGIIR